MKIFSFKAYVNKFINYICKESQSKYIFIYGKEENFTC